MGTRCRHCGDRWSEAAGNRSVDTFRPSMAPGAPGSWASVCRRISRSKPNDAGHDVWRRRDTRSICGWCDPVVHALVWAHHRAVRRRRGRHIPGGRACVGKIGSGLEKDRSFAWNWDAGAHGDVGGVRLPSPRCGPSRGSRVELVARTSRTCTGHVDDRCDRIDDGGDARIADAGREPAESPCSPCCDPGCRYWRPPWSTLERGDWCCMWACYRNFARLCGPSRGVRSNGRSSPARCPRCRAKVRT